MLNCRRTIHLGVQRLYIMTCINNFNQSTAFKTRRLSAQSTIETSQIAQIHAWFQ